MSLLTLVFRSATAERLFRLTSTGYQVDLSDHSALAERKKQRNMKGKRNTYKYDKCQLQK